MFILSKKASDVVILDVSSSTSLCDYFVICSANSKPQAQAIHDELVKLCKKNEFKLHHSEKDELMRWILLDSSDVIIHIFLEEARLYYNLEYVWPKAKRIHPHLPKKIKKRLQ